MGVLIPTVYSSGPLGGSNEELCKWERPTACFLAQAGIQPTEEIESFSRVKPTSVLAGTRWVVKRHRTKQIIFKTVAEQAE